MCISINVLINCNVIIYYYRHLDIAIMHNCTTITLLLFYQYVLFYLDACGKKFNGGKGRVIIFDVLKFRSFIEIVLTHPPQISIFNY